MIRDDNGYARVKRWREKNRARYNLYQRNYRKGLRVNPEYVKATHEDEIHLQPSKSKIEELRELITNESEKPTETSVAVPAVFRDDYGRVISEAQWQRLQERKKRATEGGYEIDAYSQ